MSDSIPICRRLSETELDRRLRETDSVERVRRLSFLKNLYQGDSIPDAIARVGRSTSTGYRWVHQWNDGGLEAMLPDYGGGRPPKLSDEEQTTFLEIIERQHPISTERAASILRAEFDVEYAAAYLPRVLERLGLEYYPPDRTQVPWETAIEDVEWDQKTPTPTTGRHPYDRQNRRSEAGWRLPE